MRRSLRSEVESGAETYPLGAVARLTGLSTHVLRAWERRYGAVRPLRTEGGTRRYREADVARLLLLRAMVQAGHPIGDVARLSDRALVRRASRVKEVPGPDLGPVLDAIERLDAPEVERLLALQLSVLGPRSFAVSVALPLLDDVGRLWKDGDLCVASEHLASVLVRSLLGASLRPSSAAVLARPILFTTPSGERHELGLLAAAVVAVVAGTNAVYLGPELPVDEVANAVHTLGAAAVALSIVRLPKRDGERFLKSLRRALPVEVEIWVGGGRSEALALPRGVQRVVDLAEFERKVSLLQARA
jgi:DNA-binding transcriptional MerR regulator